MVTLLKETKDHTHIISKVQNDWWMELIENETGMVQILICDTNEIAMGQKSGDLIKLSKCLDRCGIPKEKGYKPGYKHNV